MTSPTAYRKSHPIDFNLADADGQPVLYIAGDATQHDLTVSLRNSSPHAIELSGDPGAEASAGNHHVALRFRPGTLSTATLQQLSGAQFAKSLATAGWKLGQLRMPASGEVVTLYLLCTTRTPWAPDESRSLALSGLSAAAASGSRGTQVELVPHQMAFQGDPTPITFIRTQYLHITNHAGSKNVPLRAVVASGSTVLSDGRTPNTLKLRITNILTADALRLIHSDTDEPTKLTIAFDVGQHEGALVESVGAAGISWGTILVGGRGGTAYSGGFRTQGAKAENLVRFWTENLSLEPGQSIELTIENLVVAGSGVANLYLRYENLSGYWDGQLVCPLEKSLIVPGEAGVGIGTPAPVGRLDVVGSKGERQGVQIDNGEIKFRSEEDEHFSIVNGQKGYLQVDASGTEKMGASDKALLSVHRTGVVGVRKLEIVGDGSLDDVHVLRRKSPSIRLDESTIRFGAYDRTEFLLLSRDDSLQVYATWREDGSFTGKTLLKLGTKDAGIGLNGPIQDLATGLAKTFIINHPQHDERYLVHATLEGPEGAVYYRGTARLHGGQTRVELPSYFEALARPEGRTVSLTNVDGFDPLAVKTQDGAQIKDGAFIVIAADASSSQAFNWEVKAVRRDVRPLDVEPLKKDLQVQGFGPYAYGIPERKGDLP